MFGVPHELYGMFESPIEVESSTPKEVPYVPVNAAASKMPSKSKLAVGLPAVWASFNILQWALSPDINQFIVFLSVFILVLVNEISAPLVLSPFTWSVLNGVAVPIPTLLLVESTLKVLVSTIKSPVNVGLAIGAFKSKALFICADVDGLELLLDGALKVKLAWAPISLRTSLVLLLSKPFEVNLAYSPLVISSLSILIAFVFDIPKVKVSCLASKAVFICADVDVI